MLSHKQLSTTIALSKTDFEKARKAIYHNETKEVEGYVCSICNSLNTTANEQLGTLLREAVFYYFCLMDDKPEFNAIKNCFANIKLLLQHNAGFYIVSDIMQNTVIHIILLQRCSRSLLWLFLLERFYEKPEFTTSKDSLQGAPADFLRSKNTQLKLVQETFSELKPACERYQKAQTEAKEAKDSKTRFLRYKEMGDLLYEHVVAKEEPLYANLYLDDVIDHYLSAAEEFSKIDHQTIVNQNRQDFFELKLFYTDTVKARLVTFESTYGIKITKLTSVDAQITSKLSLVKFPVQGFSSTTFFSEQEKKDSKAPLATIKDIDQLIRQITPNSGNQQGRVAAIADLEKILLSAEGQKLLKTNETQKLEIVHLLENKIYYDMADTVQTEAKNLLFKICPSMRKSITERLSNTANGKQVSSPHLTGSSVRVKPSPHQTQVAQELLSSYDEDRQRIEATNTAMCTSTAASSYTQLASIFAQHLGEATTSSAKLSTQGYHYAKIEPNGTDMSVVTTSSSMFSVGTSSIWSADSSSVIRHRTTTQVNDPSSTIFSFTASS